ncbi:SIS domain-containing protein [Allokutzneria sp. A3M-2-11 16]|uniref:D-sedoheptulose-7-phosphate isomerase n=1 Tax=Allokutzneria sp. A3M-2-11 16 TaxID=2962043 RepID=UPI0020B8D02F|nr:SIS domain-containing protein [Allokutzneria sp. A3M-2-11 16]MCP3804900.1 SIS domain-containing protein [Allokutzneria sp. A3M-2-11 16]
MTRTLPDPIARDHIDALTVTLSALRKQSSTLGRWGRVLAERLDAGARLLAAGNGGSAAEAQHFTAELVGRFRDDRRPFSALALNAETSSVTAISNDYGYEQVFARQVTAHARPGDVLLLLSTSGRSPNLLRAAEAGHTAGALVWALTGSTPNPLYEAVDEAVALPGSTSSVQEAQLVAVHVLCEAFEAALSEVDAQRRVS